MIKNIPITFQNTGLSAADQEQLSILYENASRKLLDILLQRLGKAGAEAFKIYITNTDPIPAVLEEKTATPTNLQQIITPSSGKDGLSKVTINAAPLEDVTPTIDLSAGNQDIISIGEGKIGMSKVVITKPETLLASNIKKDVVIFGITGTYEAS